MVVGEMLLLEDGDGRFADAVVVDIREGIDVYPIIHARMIGWIRDKEDIEILENQREPDAKTC